MRLKVVITAEARGDYDDIIGYVAQDSLPNAEWLADALETAALELDRAARRYPLIPDHADSGIRRRVVSSYNIYYRITGDVVEVLHILHGARDHERILFPDD